MFCYCNALGWHKVVGLSQLCHLELEYDFFLEIKRPLPDLQVFIKKRSKTKVKIKPAAEKPRIKYMLNQV